MSEELAPYCLQCSFQWVRSGRRPPARCPQCKNPEWRKDYREQADAGVQVIAPREPSIWAKRIKTNPVLPAIFIMRGSVSRPWQLERSTPTLVERLHYDGPISQVLFESVCEAEGSKACCEYAMSSGYFDKVVEIKPQAGHGYAVDLAFRRFVDTPYFLKAEDDFHFVQDVDLNHVVALMEAHPGVNQISWNKRPNEGERIVRPAGKPECVWKALERDFNVAGFPSVAMTTRDKWWFGNSIWRMSFVRQCWQFYAENVHNYWNDRSLFPFLFGSDFREKWDSGIPAELLAEKLGSWWWGPKGHPQMTEHTGKGDSIWAGQLQKTWAAQGKHVLGRLHSAPGNSS